MAFIFFILIPLRVHTALGDLLLSAKRDPLQLIVGELKECE